MATLLRPTNRLQDVLSAARQRLKWNEPTDLSVRIGIHVRRGDKINETPLVPLEVYVRFVADLLPAAKALAIARGDTSGRVAVFLASDDPHVAAEAAPLLSSIGIDRLLWDDSEQRYNNFNVGMVTSNAALASQESETAATIISLLGECDWVLGMENAQFAILGGLLAVSRADLDANRHIMIDPHTQQRGHWTDHLNLKV
jgi:hypothetical protein